MKEPNPELGDAIDNILHQKGKVRYESYKLLMKVADKTPELIKPYWKLLVELLEADDEPDKLFLGINLLGILAKSTDIPFDEIYDKYSQQIKHPSVVVSPHVARYLGMIAKSKPEFKEKITDTLLNAEKSLTTKHNDLVAAYIINAFAEYYDQITKKAEVTKFVEKYKESSSPKARKAVKDFLKKYSL